MNFVIVAILMSIGPVLAIGHRIDRSCMQASIGLEGCCRTIAACGHTNQHVYRNGKKILWPMIIRYPRIWREIQAAFTVQVMKGKWQTGELIYLCCS